MTTMYRQGDVLIVAATTQEPQDLIPRDNGRIVLAYGEVTGHAHAILDREAELRTIDGTEDRFLRIMAASGVALVHEEHDAITLPPGDYIVRRQREYTSANQAPIRVAD
jgi:hypothetical protein